MEKSRELSPTFAAVTSGQSVSTDDLILSIATACEERERPLFVPARDKDFVAVCTDCERDRWALFPVAELDERGEVMSVHWQRGTVEPIFRIRKRRPHMLVLAEIITDRPAVRALCWVEHDGLHALRETIRPHVSSAEPAVDAGPGMPS